MSDIVTELYVEIYWRLFRIFKNENIAVGIDLLLLSVFQLLNIYSILVIIQRLLTVDLTGYFMHKPLFLSGFCVVIFGINFLMSRSAKKLTKKEDIEMFISRRFVSYVILSIVLFGFPITSRKPVAQLVNQVRAGHALRIASVVLFHHHDLIEQVILIAV